MLRGAWAVLIIAGLGQSACGAAAKHKEITDPEEARLDPDFLIQGEYLGAGKLGGGAEQKVGAQTIALGKGEFSVVIYTGGLPGAGWKRGDPRFCFKGQRHDGAVELSGAEGARDTSGRIEKGKLSFNDRAGRFHGQLGRIERQSPTLATKPPQGAMVLFDARQGVNRFPKGNPLPNGSLQAEAVSVPLPDCYTMHVEFRLSYMPTARGQGRSNSGVYLHDCYEIQVLDSFGLEGADNECGGIYKLQRPAVNMCLPPLVWQSYDIEFAAPKYDTAGQKRANARLSVRHNGVPIYQDLELPQGTPGRQKEGPGPRPVYFQGHGNKVEYRNVWLVEKK